MKVYCLICKKWFEVNDKSMPCLECGLRMCGLEGIADKFPDYEAETAREVSRWMNTPPGAITEGINKIVDGIAGRVGIVVPQIVTGEITKQVTTLLEFLQDLSCYTIILDEKALYKKLEELFGEGHIAEALAKVITLASGQGVLQQANKLGYQVGTVND